MDSDNDSYFEGSSHDEQEVAVPLHIKVQMNLEESLEFREAGPPSPVLTPHPIPVGELSPVWELPDDGTNFYEVLFKSLCARSESLARNNWTEKE